MERDIEAFIKDYVKNLHQGTASLFAGAGLSIAAGYVSWSDLLRDIADELGLKIEHETDLVSLAQFHLNEIKTRATLTQKIVDEFVEDAEETENHEIISRLPISSIWTTNYDQLIEDSARRKNKIVDVKFNVDQLHTTVSKRDLVVYKMHGDVQHSSEAIITKEQYEQYYQTHEPFITALSGELITKTFLFIGFSFTDPNLDYVLSRLHYRHKNDKRRHYCFIKKHKLGDSLNPDRASLDYNLRRQELRNGELRRYGITPLLIEEYTDIPKILKEVERRYKRRSIFISGSAITYGDFSDYEGRSFVHLLSGSLISNKFRIINGFGCGVGSSVINGALQTIYNDQKKHSEDQLVIKPFPQFATGELNLKDLWEEYRKQMISMAGAALFVFGNKRNDSGDTVIADGVLREFEIANQMSCILIPVGLTGFAASELFKIIDAQPSKYYKEPEKVIPLLKELSSFDSYDKSIEAIEKIIDIIKLH